LMLDSGKHLLLADEPGDFADALANMLSKAELRNALADAGRERVLQKYTWKMLGGELSGYYEELKMKYGKQGQ